jgi:hypothetical protein
MQRKSSRLFWFYRIYCLSVLLAWNFIFFSKMMGSKPPGSEIVILMPMIVPTIFWTLNAGAFTWSYSIFGKLKRTLPPAEPPIARADGTGGIVGWCRATAPFVSWAVYPNGLSVSILLIGQGYVSCSEFREVKPFWGGGCKISHCSAEVRSPLVIPSKRIAAAIQQIHDEQT